MTTTTTPQENRPRVPLVTVPTTTTAASMASTLCGMCCCGVVCASASHFVLVWLHSDNAKPSKPVLPCNRIKSKLSSIENSVRLPPTRMWLKLQLNSNLTHTSKKHWPQHQLLHLINSLKPNSLRVCVLLSTAIYQFVSWELHWTMGKVLLWR